MRRKLLAGMVCLAALAVFLWYRNTEKTEQEPIPLPPPQETPPEPPQETPPETPPAEEPPARTDDDPLAQLQGVWQEDSGLVLTFSGSTLTYGPKGQPGQTVEVRATRDQDTGEIRVLSADPGKEGVGDFGPIVFRDGIINTTLPFVRDES